MRPHPKESSDDRSTDRATGSLHTGQPRARRAAVKGPNNIFLSEDQALLLLPRFAWRALAASGTSQIAAQEPMRARAQCWNWARTIAGCVQNCSNDTFPSPSRSSARQRSFTLIRSCALRQWWRRATCEKWKCPSGSKARRIARTSLPYPLRRCCMKEASASCARLWASRQRSWRRWQATIGSCSKMSACQGLGARRCVGVVVGMIGRVFSRKSRAT
mmetsp:Transcript_35813/g.102310  ORF Transcript_35813/g.102310 Transcript_35813/m.102310 type:complete len:217 (+) Transcript_35813:1416-2066(+)